MSRVQYLVRWHNQVLCSISSVDMMSWLNRWSSWLIRSTCMNLQNEPAEMWSKLRHDWSYLGCRVQYREKLLVGCVYDCTDVCRMVHYFTYIYTPRHNHFFCSFSFVHVTFLAREENCMSPERDESEIWFGRESPSGSKAEYSTFSFTLLRIPLLLIDTKVSIWNIYIDR